MDLFDLSPSDGGWLNDQDQCPNAAVEPCSFNQLQEVVKVNLLGLPEEGGTKGRFDNLSLNLKFDEAAFPTHLVSRSCAVVLARGRRGVS